jgi:hypothetical protein
MVVSNGSLAAPKLEIAEDAYLQLLWNVDPQAPRLEQGSERDHVIAAEDGVDLRVARHQLGQSDRATHRARSAPAA